MLQKVKPILIWYLEPPPSTKDKILRSCHRCSTSRKSSKHRQHGSYCAANYLSTAQKMRPNIGALFGDRRDPMPVNGQKIKYVYTCKE